MEGAPLWMQPRTREVRAQAPVISTLLKMLEGLMHPQARHAHHSHSLLVACCPVTYQAAPTYSVRSTRMGLHVAPESVGAVVEWLQGLCSRCSLQKSGANGLGPRRRGSMGSPAIRAPLYPRRFASTCTCASDENVTVSSCSSNLERLMSYPGKYTATW